ncbi:MAG: aconitase family protein, partial [Defluviitaleaceae bacterium]|nr:aconitase family protein [Defluviitaleaceae bacterium]
QAVIAGCAGGLYESICGAAEILDGRGAAMPLSVYPASQPMYLSLMQNGVTARLMREGAILKTAFCGPCFGAGDVPRNGGFSIRHVTRNFPNREGSKPNMNQSAEVALMDALSIAATVANGGVLTPATQVLESNPSVPKYFFESGVYTKSIYKGAGKPDKNTELVYGPGIRDWPEFKPLGENILLQVASFITDDVTTTDELIPSGETSTFRSNPYALAEHTLSRKDPEYVGRAKAIAEKSAADLTDVTRALEASGQKIATNTAVGSVVYARKPGDGSAREQAASCQRVLGGLANIAIEYATKRYRSNLINWGMLPFIFPKNPPFEVEDFIYIPNIRAAVESREEEIPSFAIAKNGTVTPFTLKLPLIPAEAEILLSGCLINLYSKQERI